MLEPKFMQEGFAYIDKDEKWQIKEDAPEWVKKEFKKFFKQISGEPDKNGMVTQY